MLLQWYHHLVTLISQWLVGPLVEPISRWYVADSGRQQTTANVKTNCVLQGCRNELWSSQFDVPLFRPNRECSPLSYKFSCIFYFIIHMDPSKYNEHEL